jgi:hypothetical protein
LILCGVKHPALRGVWAHWADPGAENPMKALHSALIADSPVTRKISVPASSPRLGDKGITMGGVGEFQAVVS